MLYSQPQFAVQTRVPPYLRVHAEATNLLFCWLFSTHAAITNYVGKFCGDIDVDQCAYKVHNLRIFRIHCFPSSCFMAGFIGRIRGGSTPLRSVWTLEMHVLQIGGILLATLTEEYFLSFYKGQHRDIHHVEVWYRSCSRSLMPRVTNCQHSTSLDASHSFDLFSCV